MNILKSKIFDSNHSLVAVLYCCYWTYHPNHVEWSRDFYPVALERVEPSNLEEQWTSLFFLPLPAYWHYHPSPHQCWYQVRFFFHSSPLTYLWFSGQWVSWDLRWTDQCWTDSSWFAGFLFPVRNPYIALKGWIQVLKQQSLADLEVKESVFKLQHEHLFTMISDIP